MTPNARSGNTWESGPTAARRPSGDAYIHEWNTRMLHAASARRPSMPANRVPPERIAPASAGRCVRVATALEASLSPPTCTRYETLDRLYSHAPSFDSPYDALCHM